MLPVLPLQACHHNLHVLEKELEIVLPDSYLNLQTHLWRIVGTALVEAANDQPEPRPRLFSPCLRLSEIRVITPKANHVLKNGGSNTT